MKIEVRLFAYFDKYLPPGSRGRQATVELPEPADVRTLVKRLGIAEEDMEGDYMPYVVIINGQHTPCDAALHEGDCVSLFPPLPGG
jgi:molybdopterin converting factor small subunit